MDFAVNMLERALGPGLFLEILTQVGTFVGAVSGVRMASVKHFDWFGAYVIGFITALGGGTLRDVLMQRPPFWMEDPSYLVTTFLAVLAVALFGRRIISEQITWFIFDTIAISIFMVIGMEKVVEAERLKAAAAGLDFNLALQIACWWKAIIMGVITPPKTAVMTRMMIACWWEAIIMGVITAVFGGVMRDICINEVPLIFRKEIYALACAAGGALYFALMAFGIDGRVCSVVCIFSIFVIRALAIKYHLGVPVLIGRRTIHIPHPHLHRKARGDEKRAHAATGFKDK